MRSIKVTKDEANVLEYIAKRSKMDCWFPTAEDKDGALYYKERDILTLMDGATPYDLDGMNGEMVCHVVNVLIKCKTIVHFKR